MKKWYIPALAGVITIVVIVGLAAFYQPPTPICKGDLEVIDGTCQCKPGYEQLVNRCVLDPRGLPDVPKICDLAPDAPECKRAPKISVDEVLEIPNVDCDSQPDPEKCKILLRANCADKDDCE